VKKRKTKPTRKLALYQEKRDFARTPEPRGLGRSAEHGALQYVVQRHDATRLHYDFRLEHDGVLKSWAVPKEPSLSTKDRRLAVQTEDHPLDYGGFEGEIPEGQYGAGSVVIWDRGQWSPINDPDEGLKDGKLDFELDGERLKGRFTLVRMAERPPSGTSKGRGKPKSKSVKANWLLLKRHDRPTAARKSAAPRARRPPSGTSKGRKRVAPDPAEVSGARRAGLQKKPAPQLATSVTRPPDGPGWLLEPKLDGYRVLCRIEDGEVTVLTRRGNDWTHEFGAIAEAARKLPCRTALVDGEAVVYDSRGVTSFQRLQNALKGDRAAIVLVAFDLVHLDGWDLSRVPLIERKRLLEQLLEGAPPAIRYGEHVTENATKFFGAACKLGLEGIVAKRGADPYRQERTRSWLKIKCLRREEFVVVGFTDPGGSRTAFGALLVATRANASEPLRYAGKVGTGFDERTLKALHGKLRPLERRAPPVDRASARGVGSGVHWVEPELVAEIAYTEWTSDGRLRHPVYVGLREDKTADQVIEERAEAPVERAAPTAAPRGAKPRVKLTHPDKVLFPEPGITKRQLADYWEQVADVALPLLRGRPLTMRRCPDGYAGQCFWQKHVGAAVPATVPRVAITQGEDPYAAVDDVASLIALAQVGVLELHVWGSRAEHLDQPDMIVFDLDPAEDVPWREVTAASLDVKNRLEKLGLNAFAKLTGGKGLHVVVPVTPGPSWPAVKKFTRAFVNEMVRDEPRRFVATMSKSKRVGKIFVDYLRNDHEATAIGAYSPRARAGAPVALPIEWDELDPDAKQAPRFGLLEVPKLIRKRKRDPWEGFDAARRSLLGE
jgi:bifunctional non-homologous end joining protein LigD